MSGKDLQDEEGVRHDPSEEQALEEQASGDASMSLDEDIVGPCMGGTLLAIEQDEKQSGISSNMASTITRPTTQR